MWAGPSFRPSIRAIEKSTGAPQLHDIRSDAGEAKDDQAEHPEIGRRLTAGMESCVANGRGIPGAKQANDVNVLIDREGGLGTSVPLAVRF